MNAYCLVKSKEYECGYCLFSLKHSWQAGQGGTHLAILLVGEFPQSPLNTQ